MSFVNVAPQLVSTAAADAARIGSAINTANTAAAATTQVLAAAQDEVSTAIAALFGSHGQHYQAISAQVAAYQQRFVLALSQAGSTYAVAEAASATPLQNVLDAINAPVQSLTGRPLIGDGANGIDGTGQAGGNAVSSRPSAVSRSKWNFAWWRGMPTASAAWSRLTGIDCEHTNW